MKSKKDTTHELQSHESQQKKLSTIIQDPAALKILILASTHIQTSELSALNGCHNLLKLDISNNGIASLPFSIRFSLLRNLQFLFLHCNIMSQIQHLGTIMETPQLRYLTLFDNPITSISSLRHLIVNSMPSLYALDFHAVADEERIERVVFTSSSRFSALSLHSQINWPLIPNQPNQILAPEEVYIHTLQEEMSIVAAKYAASSPSLFIQRCWRGFICRRKLRNDARIANVISSLSQRVSSKWKKHASKRFALKEVLEQRGKNYLLLTGVSLKQQRGLNKLKSLLKEIMIRFRLRKQLNKASVAIFHAMQKFHRRMEHFRNTITRDEHKQIFFHRSQFRSILLIFQQSVKHIHQGSKSYGDSLKLHEKIVQQLKNAIDQKDPNIAKIGEEAFKNTDKKPMNQYSRLISLRVSDSFDHSSYSTQTTLPFMDLILPSLQSKVLFLSAKKPLFYELNKNHPVLNKFKTLVTLPNLDLAYKHSQALTKHELNRYTQKYSVLQKYQSREYLSLVQLCINDDAVLTAFLQAIHIHNSRVRTKYHKARAYDAKEEEGIVNNFKEISKQEIFLKQKDQHQISVVYVYFEKYLRLVSAAMKIQKYWRAFASQQTCTPVFRVIQEKRAITKIQRWIRRIRWHHRRAFWNKLTIYLSGLKPQASNSFYLHLDTYMNLLKIAEVTHSHQTLIFKEQESIVTFELSHNTVRIDWDFENNSHDFARERNKRVFPTWIGVEKGLRVQEEELIGDCMHIIHTGTRSSITQINGLKFIKIEFPFFEEFRYRACALALLTYRFKKNGFYVKFYTDEELRQLPFMISEVQNLMKIYKIQFNYEPSKVEIVSSAIVNNATPLFLASYHQNSFITRAQQVSQEMSMKSVTMFRKLENSNDNMSTVNKIQANLFIFISHDVYLGRQKEIMQEDTSRSNRPLLRKTKDNLLNQTNSRKESKENYNSSQYNPNIPTNNKVPNKDTKGKEKKRESMSFLERESRMKFANCEFDSETISLRPSSGQVASRINNLQSRKEDKPQQADIFASGFQLGCMSAFLLTFTGKTEESVEHLRSNKTAGNQRNIACRDNLDNCQKQRQQSVQEQRKRRFFVQQIAELDKEIQIKVKRQQIVSERTKRERVLSLQSEVQREEKLQLVESLRDARRSQKEEENEFVSNFTRGSNFLIRQATAQSNRQNKAIQQQSLQAKRQNQMNHQRQAFNSFQVLQSQQMQLEAQEYQLQLQQQISEPSYEQSQQQNDISSRSSRSSNSGSRMVGSAGLKSNYTSVFSPKEFNPYVEQTRPFSSEHQRKLFTNPSNKPRNTFHPYSAYTESYKQAPPRTYTQQNISNSVQHEKHSASTQERSLSYGPTIALSLEAGSTINHSDSFQGKSLIAPTTASIDIHRIQSSFTEQNSLQHTKPDLPNNNSNHLNRQLNNPRRFKKAEAKLRNLRSINGFFPEELYPMKGNSFQLQL